MKKLTDNDPETKSPDFAPANLAALRELFPLLVTEGPNGVAVNVDVLKQLVGDHTVTDAAEKYGLNWHGKRRARQLALTPSTGTLRPCPDDSLDWNSTQNIVIEGDNLEVLKLLQKSYAGKIKLIYMDPPYNTGKDFVYPDDFRDNIQNYLALTGQAEGGRKISSNAEASGRFHTDWLSMMYPRLLLARNLMSEDGVMFVSIDENEVANLKSLLSAVLGEENVIGTIANINNPKGRSDDRYLATAHEYIVVVTKNAGAAKIYGFEPEENITRRYNKKDLTGRRYREIDLRKTGDEDLRSDRPDMFYYFYYDAASAALSLSKTSIALANAIEIIPIREDGKEGRWRWGFDTATRDIGTLIARYMPNRKIWGVFEKDYLDNRPPVKSTTAWTFKDVNSERGSEQLIELGFSKETFPRPKPLGTMKRILEIGTLPECKSIVCDLFAGSGSFLHAAMQLTSEGVRDIRYIGVQLPEPTRVMKSDGSYEESEAWKEGCATIADITKERLRRAGKAIADATTDDPSDIGFRVFKLASSNIRAWQPNTVDLEDSLRQSAEHLIPDRSEEDVLYEVLLKLGLDLCVPIDVRIIAGKKVSSVGGGVLIACLVERIEEKEVEPLAQGIVDWHKVLEPAGNTTCIFRDSAFADDVAKSNLAAILEQHGLTTMRSI